MRGLLVGEVNKQASYLSCFSQIFSRILSRMFRLVEAGLKSRSLSDLSEASRTGGALRPYMSGSTFGFSSVGLRLVHGERGLGGDGVRGVQGGVVVLSLPFRWEGDWSGHL